MIQIGKDELSAQLKKIGAFWSYAPESLRDLPDVVLIEECLRWGDVFELFQLFRIFPIQMIRTVWRERVIPDERIFAHNQYLAKFFFGIKNPKRYIVPLQKKYSRYERIAKLTA